MASGLSFMFNARLGGAQNLVQGLTLGAVKAPDILHYAWAVEIPGLTNPEGLKTYLLTTVYDEDFDAYIGDLVNADYKNTGGKFFDAAASAIDGMQGMVPVHENLSDFIEFIAERDLTQTNPAGEFKQFYPWTAALIHSSIPTPPGQDKP